MKLKYIFSLTHLASIGLIAAYSNWGVALGVFLVLLSHKLKSHLLDEKTNTIKMPN
jgi:hypothetical protein